MLSDSPCANPQFRSENGRFRDAEPADGKLWLAAVQNPTSKRLSL